MTTPEISREEAALITAAIATYLAKPPPQPERRAEPAPLLQGIEKRMTHMESEYKAYVQGLLDERFSHLEKRLESLERILLALRARVERSDLKEGVESGASIQPRMVGGLGEKGLVRPASTTGSVWSLLGRYTLGERPERRRRR